MLKTEFKAMTKQWFLSKGFKKDTDGDFVYAFPRFEVVVMFIKDRFDEWFYFSAGFNLEGFPKVVYGQEGIEVPKKYWYHYETADGAKHVSKGAIYYEKWDKEDYRLFLEEVYNTHIRPYIEKGVKHLKALTKERRIHPDVVEAIKKM